MRGKSPNVYFILLDSCTQTFPGTPVVKILNIMEVENEENPALSGLMAG